MAQRPRRTECRKQLTPAVTTGARQKMYGAACRLAAPKAGADTAPADLAH
jgi:hypothetical protein